MSAMRYDDAMQCAVSSDLLSMAATLQGNSNKLMMLQKLLNDTPPVSSGGVDWLWWLDIDIAIDPAQASMLLSCAMHGWVQRIRLRPCRACVLSKLHAC